MERQEKALKQAVDNAQLALADVDGAIQLAKRQAATKDAYTLSGLSPEELEVAAGHLVALVGSLRAVQARVASIELGHRRGRLAR